MSTNEHPSGCPPHGRRWFQFSLRTALLVMFGVALFLAGRASVEHRDAFAPPLDGKWMATYPLGHQQEVKVTKLGDGRYSLSTGGNLSGTYEWQGGRLVVVQPSDKRYVGLVWKWDGQRLVLIEEPNNRPAGASYTGTTLTRPTEDSGDDGGATR